MSWNQRNITDPDKAEALAKAFFDLLRINISVSDIDFNHDEEEDYDTWAEDIKRKEKEVFDRFYLATDRTLYRVGSDLFVDGAKI